MEDHAPFLMRVFDPLFNTHLLSIMCTVFTLAAESFFASLFNNSHIIFSVDQQNIEKIQGKATKSLTGLQDISYPA